VLPAAALSMARVCSVGCNPCRRRRVGLDDLGGGGGGAAAEANVGLGGGRGGVAQLARLAGATDVTVLRQRYAPLIDVAALRRLRMRRIHKQTGVFGGQVTLKK